MRVALAALPVLLGFGTAAYAGPPYVTDDPEAPEPGKWEVYSFVEGEHLPEGTEGAVALDINYGAAKYLQLTTEFGVGFADDGSRAGLSDLEFAAKYKFVHQTQGAWVPDVAFYPSVTVPIGSNGFGGEKATLFLPLWGQKDIGDWSLFGGGGFTINPGAENKDYWVTGFAITRQVSDRLNLGAELYHETADEVGGKGTTGLGVGMSYELSQRWALLASAGPHLSNRRAAGDFAFYIGIGFAN